MVYAFCIIVGTITTMFSLFFLQEYSGGDEYVYIFVLVYTVGIYTAYYGLVNICSKFNKNKRR